MADHTTDHTTGPATDHVTTSRGDRVAYDLYPSGAPTGPALVFVAGAGPYRATDPVTTETAKRVAALGVTAVVFDRLGRGDSPATGRLDLDRELAAVDALIDLVGGAALCGHSSGCAISLRAAARDGADGDAVTALALWEAPLTEPADETLRWAGEIERRMDAGDLAGATEHFMKDMPPEWLAGAKASPDWERIAASVVSQRADAQALAWAQRALDDTTLAPRVPVLATYGAETFPGMPEAAERIAAVVPDGTAERLPGAGHTWEPEAMARRLAAFVGA